MKNFQIRILYFASRHSNWHLFASPPKDTSIQTYALSRRIWLSFALSFSLLLRRSNISLLLFFNVITMKCSLIHCFVVLLPHLPSHTLRACIHRRPLCTSIWCWRVRVCAFVVRCVPESTIPALNLSIVLSLSSSESFRADAHTVRWTRIKKNSSKIYLQFIFELIGFF